MSRNVVLCCDGTAERCAKHHTSVLELHAAIRHDRATQVTCDHPGLDTMEPAGALTTLAWKTTRMLGMAVGDGLSDDVRDESVFLMPAHESLTGASKLAGYVPKKDFDVATRSERRRTNLGRRRTIPGTSLVHASAFERGDEYRNRLPVDAMRVDRRPRPTV